MAYYDDMRVVDYNGDGIRHPAHVLYEKTTDDLEVVVGKVGKKGTAAYQVKLCGAADVPTCIFDKQRPGPLVNEKPSTNHAKDGEPVTVIGKCSLAYFILGESQTIVVGNSLDVDVLGTTVIHAAGTIVARAAEDKSTGVGENAPILAWNLINSS